MKTRIHNKLKKSIW